MKKVFFYSKDNLKLCGVWHFPDKPTTKVVILIHGITVDKDENGNFIELAEFLKDKGFAVFRFDFRGHGESAGDSKMITIKGEIADLSAAVDLVKQEGYQNIGLFGCSFGGGIATLYVAENVNKEIKCLSLLSPCLNYDHIFLNPYLPWLAKQKDNFKQDFIEKGWIEIGSRKFKIGKQLFWEMKKVYPYKELSRITIPIFLLHGNKDDHVPHNDSKEYSKHIKKLYKFLTIYNEGHGFPDKPDNKQILKTEVFKFFQKYL